jgi:3-carboxy-cis,cis-muconate cycloisomerase
VVERSGEEARGTASALASRRVAAIFGTRSQVAAMLRVEAAIAAAEADVELVPAEGATAIAAACDVERYDVASLERAAIDAGNLAIPLVRALGEQVAEDARGWVHLGATSQDLLDSAAMLQARDAIDLLIEELGAIGVACTDLARRHVGTVMAARTLLQHATPTTFGLKAAHWLRAATDGIERLGALRASLPAQLGGAAGTLAALGEQGPAVVERLADRLELAVPDLPWHTDREPVARLAAEIAIVAGGAAKIALDVALLMQTEVGEVVEGGAPGPSSAMPQKRNPVHAPAAIAAARLATAATGVVLDAIPQEHERGLGSWHAEREALTDVFRYGTGAVEHVRAIVDSLEIDPVRMRANLELAGGTALAEALVSALVPHVGRAEAFRLVQRACERVERDDVSLREAAAREAAITSILDPEAVDAALEPSAYLGSARMFVESAIARFEGMAAEHRTP